MSANELAKQAQENPSQSTFEALWLQLLAFTKSLCWRYEDSEDRQQEAYFAMVQAVESWDSEAGMSFAGWYKMYVRARFRRTKQPVELLTLDCPVDDEDLFGVDLVTDPTAERPFDSETELEKDVRRAMSQLPERLQHILFMVYWLELPQAAIARNLGMHSSFVSAEKRRALRMLRNDTVIQQYAPTMLHHGTRVDQELEWRERMYRLHLSE